MRNKKLILLVCALLLILNSSVSAAGLSVAIHGSVNWDADDTISAASGMSSEWVRDEIRWKYVEWTKGNFAIPSSAAWVNKAIAAGMKPLCILGYGNGSYQENGDEYTSLHLPTLGTKTGDAAVKEQEYWDAWMQYVRLVVTTFKGKIPAYEVWNEPNYAPFNNNVDATNYAKLYLATRSLIKSIDPDATVICGSVTGAEQAEVTFINGVLDYIRNNGGLSQIDVFSIHLYVHGSTPEANYISGLNYLYSNTFAVKGYTGDIWMTENGTYTGTASRSVSEADQAAIAIRQTVIWDYFVNSKNINGLNFWYDLKNDGTDLTECEDNFGLMYNDFTPKPSYTAAALFNRLAGGMSFDSLSINSGKYVARYSDNKGNYTYVAWKTGSGTASVSIDIAERDTKVYSLSGSVTQSFTGRGTRSFTVSSSPILINSVPLDIEFGDNTVINYDSSTKRVSVSGSIVNFDSAQELSFLVVPHGTVLSNSLDPGVIGYIGSVRTSTASFSHFFALPGWFCGDADIYVCGLGMSGNVSSSKTVPDNQYLYVAGIDVDKSSLTATAALRNFTSQAKNATIIVAAYKEGKLVGMNTETVTVPEKTYSPTEVTTVSFSAGTPIDTAKAFVWTDLSGLIPLTSPAIK